MKRSTSLWLVSLLLGVGLAAVWLGPNAVLIRFIHRDFPGGSLTLAGHVPIMIEKVTGSRHFIRWIDGDSSIVLKCGSSAAATAEDIGYLTTGLWQYVVLDVEGCTVKRLDISRFP
jgi:hypothetical protein